MFLHQLRKSCCNSFGKHSRRCQVRIFDPALTERHGENGYVVFDLPAVNPLHHLSLVFFAKLPRERSIRSRFHHDNLVQILLPRHPTGSFPNLLDALLVPRSCCICAGPDAFGSMVSDSLARRREVQLFRRHVAGVEPPSTEGHVEL